MGYLSINLPYVKDLKADDPLGRVLVSAVDQSNIDLLNAPAIFGGTIDAALIGATQAGDAYFLSLTTGNSVSGYPVTFLGNNGTFARWLPDRALWDVQGGLRVSDASYLGDLTFKDNVISPSGVNSDLHIQVGGRGKLVLDRLPLLSQERGELDAGLLIEYQDQQGFFGAREDGFFSWVPQATVVVDGDGRRTVLGSPGKIQASEIKADVITSETGGGLLFAGETRADVLTVDGKLDASNAEVIFSNGQLSGDWVEGGTIRADLHGNATTVTDGVYRRDFQDDHTILKADRAGQPVELHVPEDRVLGRTKGGLIAPLTLDDLLGFADGPLKVSVAGNAATVTDGVYRRDLLAHSVLKADEVGKPTSVVIPEGHLLGRTVGGLVGPLSPTDVIDLLPDPVPIRVVDGLTTHDFDAPNTILKSDETGAPTALHVPSKTILGRSETGGVAALTLDDLVGFADGPLNISITGSATSVEGGLYRRDYSKDGSILIADVRGDPHAVTIPEGSFLGRLPGGDVGPVRPLQFMGLLPDPLPFRVADGLRTTDFMDDHTILKADQAGRPLILHVPERRIIGRSTGGVIDVLTLDDLLAFADGPLGVSVQGNAGTVTDGVYGKDFNLDNSILRADHAGRPEAIAVPEGNLIARLPGKGVGPVTPLEYLGLLPDPVPIRVLGGLRKTDFMEPHTILKADIVGEPVTLYVPERTFIGRKAGGVIDALTLAEALTFADGPLDVNVSGNAASVTDGLYRRDFNLDYSVLTADASGAPMAVAIPEGSLLGRLPGMGVGPLSPLQYLSLLPDPLPVAVLNGLRTDHFMEDHTLLKADQAGLPVSMYVPEKTVIGRGEGGLIAPMTLEDLLTYAVGPLKADIEGNAASVTDGLYQRDFALAHTILKADVPGDPTSIFIPEKTLVGRDEGGVIGPLTLEEAIGFAIGPLAVDISGNAESVTGGLYSRDYALDHSVLVADMLGRPHAVHLPAGTFLGRRDADGPLGPLTVLELISLFPDPVPIKVLNGLRTDHFSADHTILKADAAGQVVELVVPEETVIGRRDGDIVPIPIEDFLSPAPTVEDVFMDGMDIGVCDPDVTTSRLLIKPGIIEGKCTLADGHLDGMRKVLVVRQLRRGQRIRVIGNLYAPMTELVDFVFRFNHESVTLEWIEKDKTWVSAATGCFDEEVSHDQGCVPATADNVLMLVDNDLAYAAPINFFDPNGPVILFVTEIVASDASPTTAIFTLCGGRDRGGVAHRICDMPGRNGEHLQLDWSDPGYPLLRYSVLPSLQTGAWNKFTVHVMQSHTSYENTIQGNVSFKLDSLALKDDWSDGNFALNLAEPYGSFIIMVRDIDDPRGASAIFMACGGFETGGVVHRINSFAGLFDEQLAMEWDRLKMPTIRFGVFPNEQTGKWYRYAVTCVLSSTVCH